MPYTLETTFMGHNPTIVIAGCGGTGGFTAEALCRLYAGRDARIVLVDPDLVEPRNLLRQNFRKSEVGRPKSQALAERLARTYEREIGFVTQPVEEEIPGGRWHGRPTLVIGCVDNPQARRTMHRMTERPPYNCWLIDAGNERDWGQVLIGNTGNPERCPRDSFKPGDMTCTHLPAPGVQRPEILTGTPAPSRDQGCAAALDLSDQDPTINPMMASIIANIVRRMAANDCPFMAIYLDLRQGSMRPVWATPENAGEALGVPPDQLTAGGEK